MKKSILTFNLTTFGCQMNYADSERIVGVLADTGLRQATPERADILIYNLCSVRQHAIDRVWGMIKNFKCQISNIKCLVITGCILPADKKKFNDKGILVLDIKKLPEWPKILLPYLTNKKMDPSAARHQTQDDIFPGDYLSLKPKYTSKFSAYVPIMTGCNNFCSYCAVPYTRGREYSRPVEEILNEVNNLVIRGYKEIILLGQNVNSYHGKIDDIFKIKNSKLFQNLKLKIQNYNKINFSDLLKIIDFIPGNYWLSFLTSHPKDISDELINCFKTCQHLIPYLHLPLQAGSNKILKAMNRQYTLADYKKFIQKVRRQYWGQLPINISTDIIVGFPGETKKDFLATVKVMEKIKFDMAYLAEYSPRPGTAAFKLKDNISAQEKEKRKNILNEVLKKTALENNQKMLGLIAGVLIDQVKNGVAFGKTRNFKRIKIVAHKKNIAKKMIGNFIQVKITKANIWNLEGELIKK